MQTKFTPGKWSVRMTESAINVYSEMHGGIVTCQHNGQHVSEHEANARIIAAAPEMYEILSAILNDNYSHETMMIKIEEILNRINQ